MGKTKVNWSGNKKYSQRNNKTGKFKRSINPNDLMDQRFGRLVVIGIDKYYRNKWYFVCKCDCGNIKIVRYDALMEGKTQSCGCYNKQVNSDRRIHGMYNTRFYNIYTGMKQRCYNPNSTYYHRYGGRGIKVCDRWLGEDGFIHFKEDMYDEYLKRAEECGGEQYISIDRINPDGDYCKENCHWETAEVQSNNKSKGVYRIPYNGEILSLKQLQKKYVPNATYSSLVHRANRTDKPIEELLYDSVEHKARIYTYNGETLPLAEIVKKYGDYRLTYHQVVSRLDIGWDLKRALHELPNTYKGKRIIKPISFSASKYIQPITFRKTILEDNRSKKKYIYKGEELTIAQLVDRYADPRLTRSIVRDRIDKGGWSIELAISTLPKRYKNKPVIQPFTFRNQDSIAINFSNNNIIEP